LNNTARKRRAVHRDLLRRLSRCRRRVWITSAYFVPPPLLLRALRHAARRNVDVRILVPGRSDIFFMPLAMAGFYKSLLKNGARIFEYGRSILHAKTMILDDSVIVGSTNLNHRSMIHDLEIDVSIQTTEARHRVEEDFLVDLANAAEITMQELAERAAWRRIASRAALLFRHWL
jgi:cardiolipin synthase